MCGPVQSPSIDSIAKAIRSDNTPYFVLKIQVNCINRYRTELNSGATLQFSGNITDLRDKHIRTNYIGLWREADAQCGN